MRARRFAWLALKVIGAFVLCVFLGIAGLLSALWWDHNRVTVLPAPSGPYAVGRITYVWSDAQHTDAMAPRMGEKRELLAWIWYPADAQAGMVARADYLPAMWREAYVRQVGPVLSQLVTRNLSRVQVHSFADAPVSKRRSSYPVVVMRGGLATLVTDYTSLAEDLASRGYVVVGFDAPYRSFLTVFPDGRVVVRAAQNNLDLAPPGKQVQLATRLAQTWSSDIAMALDQMRVLNSSDPAGRFAGRLDLERVGVFGHSLGGATALQFCHDDARCKAGIDVDGLPLGSVIAEGLRVPFLFLLSDHSSEQDAVAREVRANIKSIFDRLPVDGRLYLVIRGANHYRFSDFGAMLQAPLVMGALQRVGMLRLDGRRQIAITAHYVSAFFDVYLQEASRAELENAAGYPEVVYVH